MEQHGTHNIIKKGIRHISLKSTNPLRSHLLFTATCQSVVYLGMPLQQLVQADYSYGTLKIKTVLSDKLANYQFSSTSTVGRTSDKENGLFNFGSHEKTSRVNLNHINPYDLNLKVNKCSCDSDFKQANSF